MTSLVVVLMRLWFRYSVAKVSGVQPVVYIINVTQHPHAALGAGVPTTSCCERQCGPPSKRQQIHTGFHGTHTQHKSMLHRTTTRLTFLPATTT